MGQILDVTSPVLKLMKSSDESRDYVLNCINRMFNSDFGFEEDMSTQRQLRRCYDSVRYRHTAFGTYDVGDDTLVVIYDEAYCMAAGCNVILLCFASEIDFLCPDPLGFIITMLLSERLRSELKNHLDFDGLPS